MQGISDNEKYKDFLLPDDDITSYLNHGVFASNVGDFIIDVCSNILCVPIVVITSIADMSLEVFLPKRNMVETQLFLAYNCEEIHYHNTASLELEQNTKKPGNKYLVIVNNCHNVLCVYLSQVKFTLLFSKPGCK